MAHSLFQEVPMQILPLLRRRDPGRPMLRDWELLEDRMDRLMRGMPLWEPVTDPFVWAPRVDFVDENGAFLLTAELPGIDPDAVEIDVEGNVLTMKGEKKVEREHKDERIQLSERRYGAFERSFTLPSTADPEQITAEFRQGVLTVHIAKRPESQGKKIKVQAG
jgi:HSP20 family protein